MFGPIEPPYNPQNMAKNVNLVVKKSVEIFVKRPIKPLGKIFLDRFFDRQGYVFGCSLGVIGGLQGAFLAQMLP